MELKEYMRENERNVLPIGWDLITIGDTCSLSQGVQVDLEYQIKEERVGYSRFLRIENYTQNSNDFRFIPEQFTKNKIVDESDIVVVRYGATAGFIGRGIRGVLANNLFKIKPKDNRILKEYLYRYLISKNTFLYFQDAMFGGAMPALGFKVVNALSIIFPNSKEEQTAIAQVLSDTDELISSLEKLIEKKKLIKQGTMQQLLTGKKHLPGFSGEWEVKKLGEIGDITGAGINKKLRSDEIPVRLVNYLDVYHRNFIYSKDLNHWVTAPEHQAQRCRVIKGDIFFTPSSETPDDIGISSIAAEDITDAGYSYHVVRLRLFEDWDFNFRAYIFKTRFFLDQAEK